jgi:hypothetical protein
MRCLSPGIGHHWKRRSYALKLLLCTTPTDLAVDRRSVNDRRRAGLALYQRTRSFLVWIANQRRMYSGIVQHFRPSVDPWTDRTFAPSQWPSPPKRRPSWWKQTQPKGTTSRAVTLAADTAGLRSVNTTCASETPIRAMRTVTGSGLIKMPTGVMAAGTDVSVFASGEAAALKFHANVGVRNGNLEPLCTHSLDHV